MSTQPTSAGSVLKGVLTNEGLRQSIIAASQDGWYIYPTGFGVSATLGDISATRTMSDLNPMWYEAAISSRVVKDISTIEFVCSIPPGVSENIQNIGEVYIFAEDKDGNEILLAINGIEGIATYDPGGATTLRVNITIQNLDLTDLYVFKYTQAMEIEEHNNDPNAHPDIQERLRRLESGGVGGNVNSTSLLYWGNI